MTLSGSYLLRWHIHCIARRSNSNYRYHGTHCMGVNYMPTSIGPFGLSKVELYYLWAWFVKSYGQCLEYSIKYYIQDTVHFRSGFALWNFTSGTIHKIESIYDVYINLLAFNGFADPASACIVYRTVRARCLADLCSSLTVHFFVRLSEITRSANGSSTSSSIRTILRFQSQWVLTLFNISMNYLYLD